MSGEKTLPVCIQTPNGYDMLVNPLSGDNYDPDGIGAIWVGACKLLYNGFGWDRARGPNKFVNIAALAVTKDTPETIWTPAAGKKFRVMGFMLSLAVAGSVILLDNAAEFMRTPEMAAKVGLASPPMGNGYRSSAANNALKINVTATGAVSGFVFGTEE